MFEIKKDAEIRAINIAKGNNDESPVCATIGLKFEGIGPPPVAAALGCEESDLDHWFRDNGELRFNGIDGIASWAVFEDRHQIKLLGITCSVSKVSAIKIKPHGNRIFEVTCNVQVQDPPKHFMESVASSLHGLKTVELTEHSQLALTGTD